MERMKAPEEIAGFRHGDKVRVTEDYEHDLLLACKGDQGTIEIEVVGAPEYGNERAILSLLLEGRSCGDELDPHDLFWLERI